MKFEQILGADISKLSIDVATPEGAHLKIQNNPAGFTRLVQWLSNQAMALDQVMVVMEHTGVYSYELEHFFHANSIAFCKVSALAIKRSLGLVRGKNDKIDSKRIARYAMEKKDQLQPCAPMDKNLERLRFLYATRNRMVRHRTSFISAMKAYRCGGLGKADPIIKSHQQMIGHFTVQIEKLESQIKAVIQGDAAIKNNYQLLIHEKGVGLVVAVATIVKTENFRRFKTSRKFACYSGTAPFEHQSGISIRGKTRVSPLSDKDMKAKLHQAAKSAIQHDPEIKQYYQRRIAAGKSKMGTLNIVSNKIISRMFAVIKRQTPFIENYRKTA